MAFRKSNSKNRKGKRLPPARQGRQSVIIAIFVTLVLIVVMISAFNTHGAMPHLFGGFSFIALMGAIIGIRQGIMGRYEFDRSTKNCRVGILWNILLLLALLMIFWLGLG